MDYKLLAYSSDVVTGDPLWNEIIANGIFSDEKIAFFGDECFIDAAADARTITFTTSDKLEYARINGRLFDKDNIRISNLVVVACDKPFEDDDPDLIELLCENISPTLYCQQIRYYRAFLLLWVHLHKSSCGLVLRSCL